MSRSAKRYVAIAAIAGLGLSGCETPGMENRADTFNANEVNTIQVARAVSIISVTPVKVQVSNASNRRTAEVAAGLLGAALGAGLGASFSGNAALGGSLAGLGGGIVGAAGGSLVPGKTLVDGVSITYRDIKSGTTLNSTQIGKTCEYAIGQATMIQTSPTTTRIQPNAVCPTRR